MKNTKELREKMVETFNKLENGEITVGKARAMSNIASVMLKSASLEHEQNRILGKTTAIEFIAST